MCQVGYGRGGFLFYFSCSEQQEFNFLDIVMDGVCTALTAEIREFEGKYEQRKGSTFYRWTISRAPWGKGAESYEIIYQSDATTSHKLS